ncbi:MAG TPA: NADH-quinone oxidoreductase subunit C [Solirubrobacterales bacterium]|nr:NADH-quinone oxidoreductase subunit C [Solirubrobacterales bacterium]
MSPALPAAPAAQALEERAIRPSEFRAACAEEVERGARFCGGYASAASGALEWTALFAAGAVTTALRTPAVAGEVPSIVGLVGAAGWDEREAHDLYGLGFAGHEPLRPLVEHPAAPADWTVPVIGEDPYDVAVGPIHAGVIESGHFRFHVVGERILLIDPRLFYKHRGLERAAEGADPGEGMAFAARACGACAVANSVAYAGACEAALGLVVDPEARRARTVLLELERLYNHLNDVSAICAGVGFAPGTMAFAALKERAMRLNRELTGHRFLFGTVTLGGSAVEIDGAAAERARAVLRDLAADTALAWRELRFAASVQARLGGVGQLTPEDAIRLGAVGPAARACGLRVDTRTASPALAYPASFEPALPPEPTGDVAARLEMRGLELPVTLELLDSFLGEPLSPAPAGKSVEGTPERTSPQFVSEGVPATGARTRRGVARVESPRGETVCAVELLDGRLARLHLRTASYANWPALAHSATDNLLPDFPLINKSFELCYACVDR